MFKYQHQLNHKFTISKFTPRFSSFRRKFIDIPDAGSFISGAAKAVREGKEYMDAKSITTTDTYVKNILASLKKPFDSPLKPEWGPIFPRKDWEREFKTMAEKRMYLLYYGASATGKSIAVSNVFAGRKGVVFCPLSDPNNVFSDFTKSIGFFGTQTGSSLVATPSVVFDAFDTACREFVTTENKKPVLIVEDLHSSKDPKLQTLTHDAVTLTSRFVRIYNAGFLNVVYTMSDFGGVGLLQSVSGHTSRLKVRPFPDIPDHELVDALTHLAVREQEAKLDNSKSVVQKMKEWFISPQVKEGILIPTEDCKYIVQKLGSHMEDVTTCLRQVLENGVAVQDAVQEQIDSCKSALQKALQAEKTAINGLDRLVFLATVHALFDILTTNETANTLEILERYPLLILKRVEVGECVRHLVALNLLSFKENENTVTLHSRKLKYAFKDLLEDKRVQLERKDLEKLKP